MSALPNHHIGDETLLAYASGTLSRSAGILVASHLTLCPSCRKALAAAEAVGGALLEATEQRVTMSCTADDILARADRSAPNEKGAALVPPSGKASAVNDNRPNKLLPRPIRELVGDDIASLKWRWMGPGVRYAFLAGDEHEGKVGLMRIAPGTRLPRHGHTGEELTMVLAGGYKDSSGQFARGDVEWADDNIVHQPWADKDGECLCLVVTKGKLKAKGLLGPLLQPLMAI